VPLCGPTDNPFPGEDTGMIVFGAPGCGGVAGPGGAPGPGGTQESNCSLSGTSFSLANASGLPGTPGHVGKQGPPGQCTE
jgi:hypothetical protein